MLLPCNVWQGSLPFSFRPPILLSKVIDKVGTYYEFGWDGMVPRLDEVDAGDIRVSLEEPSAVQTPLFIWLSLLISRNQENRQTQTR